MVRYSELPFREYRLRSAKGTLFLGEIRSLPSFEPLSFGTRVSITQVFRHETLETITTATLPNAIPVLTVSGHHGMLLLATICRQMGTKTPAIRHVLP